MAETITSDMAARILVSAQARAEGLGLRMTFAVTDAAGYLLALVRMDGAKILAPDIAAAKAYTAAAFQAPSGDVAERFRDAPMFVQSVTAMTGGKFIPHPGGIPIVDGGRTIGALGVSGGTADEDVDVARGALADAGLATD